MPKMNASLLAALNDAERLLVAQTERAELAKLDEDAAIDLEARIRRARNKYVGQYRRGASARVVEHAARGQAAPENQLAALKAEAFEEALARVSRRVAVLARQSAAALAPRRYWPTYLFRVRLIRPSNSMAASSSSAASSAGSVCATSSRSASLSTASRDAFI